MKELFDVIGIGSGCIDVLHTERGRFVCQGGAVANTIYSLQKLGLRTGYIGRVGDDKNGKMFAESLKSNGTDLSRLRMRGKTATCHIKVTPERRDMFLQRNFNSMAKLTKNDINYLKSARSVFMRISSKIFKDVAKLCKANNKMLFVSLHELDDNLDVYRLIKGARINVIFSGMYRMRILAPYLDRTLDRGTILVMTKGRHGCNVLTADDSLSIKAPVVKPLDPTGAGDAFAAGFVYGILNGWTPKESGKLANHMGSLAITEYGARTAIKPLDKSKIFEKIK